MLQYLVIIGLAVAAICAGVAVLREKKEFERERREGNRSFQLNESTLLEQHRARR